MCGERGECGDESLRGEQTVFLGTVAGPGALEGKERTPADISHLSLSSIYRRRVCSSGSLYSLVQNSLSLQ